MKAIVRHAAAGILLLSVSVVADDEPQLPDAPARTHATGPVTTVDSGADTGSSLPPRPETSDGRTHTVYSIGALAKFDGELPWSGYVDWGGDNGGMCSGAVVGCFEGTRTEPGYVCFATAGHCVTHMSGNLRLFQGTGKIDRDTRARDATMYTDTPFSPGRGESGAQVYYNPIWTPDKGTREGNMAPATAMQAPATANSLDFALLRMPLKSGMRCPQVQPSDAGPREEMPPRKIWVAVAGYGTNMKDGRGNWVHRDGNPVKGVVIGQLDTTILRSGGRFVLTNAIGELKPGDSGSNAYEVEYDERTRTIKKVKRQLGTLSGGLLRSNFPLIAGENFKTYQGWYNRAGCDRRAPAAAPAPAVASGPVLEAPVAPAAPPPNAELTANVARGLRGGGVPIDADRLNVRQDPRYPAWYDFSGPGTDGKKYAGTVFEHTDGDDKVVHWNVWEDRDGGGRRAVKTYFDATRGYQTVDAAKASESFQRGFDLGNRRVQDDAMGALIPADLQLRLGLLRATGDLALAKGAAFTAGVEGQRIQQIDFTGRGRDGATSGTIVWDPEKRAYVVRIARAAPPPVPVVPRLGTPEDSNGPMRRGDALPDSGGGLPLPSTPTANRKELPPTAGMLGAPTVAVPSKGEVAEAAQRLAAKYEGAARQVIGGPGGTSLDHSGDDLARLRTILNGSGISVAPTDRLSDGNYKSNDGITTRTVFLNSARTKAVVIRYVAPRYVDDRRGPRASSFQLSPQTWNGTEWVADPTKTIDLDARD